MLQGREPSTDAATSPRHHTCMRSQAARRLPIRCQTDMRTVDVQHCIQMLERHLQPATVRAPSSSADKNSGCNPVYTRLLPPHVADRHQGCMQGRVLAGGVTEAHRSFCACMSRAASDPASSASSSSVQKMGRYSPRGGRDCRYPCLTTARAASATCRLLCLGCLPLSSNQTLSERPAAK